MMVTKQQQDESPVDLSASLKCEFNKMLDESIPAMKDSRIEGLKASPQ